jgi:hypothetical protein
VSAAPDSNDREAEIERRENEIKRQLAELKELEEAKLREQQQPETLPVPAAPDPATLDPAEQRKLEALRKAEQLGRTALDRQFPVMWNPLKSPEHPNEIPAALITRIDPHVGPSRDFGTYAAVLEIRDSHGREWSVWANKPDGALWHQLLRLKLQPGDVIALRDNGRRPSKRDPNRKVRDVVMRRVGDDTGADPIDYGTIERVPEVPAPPPQAQQQCDDGDDIPF